MSRVEATRVPYRRSRVRVALAGALTSAALVAFALVGGFSYTVSAANAVAKATGVSKANNGGGKGKGSGNGNEAKANASNSQYQEKVVICHRPPGNPSNGQTLRLPPPAADAHLRNHPDDTLGPCP